jgi:hypothetical protein
MKQCNELEPWNHGIIPGYGGVAILYRHSLSENIKNLNVFHSDRLCGIEISGVGGIKLFIISVYMPQKGCYIADFQNVLDELETVACTLSTMGELMIVGDWNAHMGVEGGPRGWGKSCKSGKKLLGFMQRCWMFCVDLQSKACGSIYTYMHPNGCSYIDHCVCSLSLTNCVSDCHVRVECVENSSDHLPVSCTVDFNLIMVPSAARTSPGRLVWERLTGDQMRDMYTKPLCDKLAVLLTKYGIHNIQADYLHTRLSDSDIELLVGEFASCMVSHANEVIPIAKYNSHLKPYWTKELTELSRLKKATHREWVLDGKPLDPNIKSRKEYKVAKKAFSYKQKQVMCEYEERNEQELRDTQFVDQSYFWHKVNKSVGRKGKTKATAIKDSTGQLVYDTREACQIWASYCEALGNVNDCDYHNDDFKKIVESILSSPDFGSNLTDHLFEEPFSIDEVWTQCKRLRHKKASGWDNVSSEHILYGGEPVSIVINCIFNHLRNSCYVPYHFRKGIKVPIFKGGKRDEHCKDDYSGITLLPIISKLYEMCLMQRADEWFNDQIDELQGAGKKGISCLHSSMILRETIGHNVERGSNVHVVLLDTKKAFDQVWVDGLFYQLCQLGMDSRLWRILRNYYTDFTCAVRWNGETSDWFKISQGVHQGGIFSMRLYCVFINGLLIELRELNVGCCTNDHFTGAVCSADDLAVASLFESTMQCMMNVCFKHSGTWRYQYNVSKCMCITYGHNACKVYLGDTAIPEVKAAIHLGSILTLRNSKEALDYTNSKVLKSKKTFYPMLGLVQSGHTLSPRIASKLYWDVCVNSLLFGVEVWDTSDKDIMVLDHAHRSMAKTIQSLPTNVANAGVLVPLGWNSIDGTVLKKRAMFGGKLLYEKNDSLPKTIFLERLTDIRFGKHSGHGLIQSPTRMIHDSCVRLGIVEILHSAVDSGGIQNMDGWCKMVKDAVRRMEIDKTVVSVSLCPSLRFLLPMVVDIKMCNWWLFADRLPKYRRKSRIIVQLLMGSLKGIQYNNGRLCGVCQNVEETDSVLHFLSECSNENLVGLRAQLFSYIRRVVGIGPLINDEVLCMCLCGWCMEDDDFKVIADLIYLMYKERVCVLKDDSG